MTITLANAEHSITSQPHRLGLLGRSYTIGLVWNDAWGKPTEWRDMKVTRFDNQPFCGAPCSEGHSCTGGASVVNAPVDGTTVRHDITLSCACSD